MQKDKPIHLILLDQPYFDTVSSFSLLAYRVSLEAKTRGFVSPRGVIKISFSLSYPIYVSANHRAAFNPILNRVKLS